MNIILSKKGSRETIESVVDLMQEDISPRYYSIRKHRFARDRPENVDLLIRWGTTVSLDSNIEINTRDAVKLASSKYECRQILGQQGIGVPRVLSYYELTNPSNYPVVERPHFHQKGKGFKLLTNPRQLLFNNECYYSTYYPKTREYRVHVASGKVLLVQEKVGTSDVSNWNHESGYSFQVVPWKEWRKDIVDLAVRGCKGSRLNFGAVDILSDPTDTNLPVAVVCEINTAPKLEGYTAQRYAEYFDWLVRTRETRTFQVPEGTSARHYAFKHREMRDLNYDFQFYG